MCSLRILLLVTILSLVIRSRGGGEEEEEEEKLLSIPTIDIASLLVIDPPNSSNNLAANRQKAIIEMQEAFNQFGFFFISNHGLEDSTQALIRQMELFFGLSKDVKHTVNRTETNSRGYSDNELTKQRKDLKEVFDVGIPVWFGNLSAEAQRNQALDGVNYWPSSSCHNNKGHVKDWPLSSSSGYSYDNDNDNGNDNDHHDHVNSLNASCTPSDQDHSLKDFRRVVESHFDKCLHVARVLTWAVLDPFSDINSDLRDYFSVAFEQSHSSFLRLNYYPLVADSEKEGQGQGGGIDEESYGVSRHTDAGLLTILYQDENYKEVGLEVYTGTKEDFGDGEWVPVTPPQGTYTVNSGDMLQVWSNSKFKAPEHRVRRAQARPATTTATKTETTAVEIKSPVTTPTENKGRFSAPFFFNPSYDVLVRPVVFPLLFGRGTSISDSSSGSSAADRVEADAKEAEAASLFNPIRWGDYRAKRFAGDFAVHEGEEIQIEHFRQRQEKEL